MGNSSETSKSDEQQQQQQTKESTDHESLQPQMVLPNTHLPDQCELGWQHEGQQIDSPYTIISATPSPHRPISGYYNEG